MSEFDARVSNILQQLSDMLEKIQQVDGGLEQVNREFNEMAEKARTVNEAAAAVDRLSTSLRQINSGFIERLNGRIEKVGEILRNLDPNKLTEVSRQYENLARVMADIDVMQQTIARSARSSAESFAVVKSTLSDLLQDIAQTDSRISSLAASIEKLVGSARDMEQVTDALRSFNGQLTAIDGAHYREVASSLDILRNSLRDFEQLKLSVDITSLVNTAPQLQSYVRDIANQIKQSLGDITVPAPSVAPAVTVPSTTRGRRSSAVDANEIKTAGTDAARQASNATKQSTIDPELEAQRKAEAAERRAVSKRASTYMKQQNMSEAEARERANADYIRDRDARAAQAQADQKAAERQRRSVEKRQAPVAAAPEPVAAPAPAQQAPKAGLGGNLDKEIAQFMLYKNLLSEIYMLRRQIAEQQLSLNVPTMLPETKSKAAQLMATSGDVMGDAELGRMVAEYGDGMRTAMRKFRGEAMNMTTKGEIVLPKALRQAGVAESEAAKKVPVELSDRSLSQFRTMMQLMRDALSKAGADEERLGAKFQMSSSFVMRGEDVGDSELFHGTSRQWSGNRFKPAYLGRNGGTSGGAGMWLTNDYEYAESFTGTQGDVYGARMPKDFKVIDAMSDAFKTYLDKIMTEQNVDYDTATNMIAKEVGAQALVWREDVGTNAQSITALIVDEFNKVAVNKNAGAEQRSIIEQARQQAEAKRDEFRKSPEYSNALDAEVDNYLKYVSSIEAKGAQRDTIRTEIEQVQQRIADGLETYIEKLGKMSVDAIKNQRAALQEGGAFSATFDSALRMLSNPDASAGVREMAFDNIRSLAPTGASLGTLGDLTVGKNSSVGMVQVAARAGIFQELQQLAQILDQYNKLLKERVADYKPLNKDVYDDIQNGQVSWMMSRHAPATFQGYPGEYMNSEFLRREIDKRGREAYAKYPERDDDKEFLANYSGAVNRLDFGLQDKYGDWQDRRNAPQPRTKVERELRNKEIAELRSQYETERERVLQEKANLRQEYDMRKARLLANNDLGARFERQDDGSFYSHDRELQAEIKNSAYTKLTTQGMTPREYYETYAEPGRAQDGKIPESFLSMLDKIQERVTGRLGEGYSSDVLRTIDNKALKLTLDTDDFPVTSEHGSRPFDMPYERREDHFVDSVGRIAVYLQDIATRLANTFDESETQRQLARDMGYDWVDDSPRQWGLDPKSNEMRLLDYPSAVSRNLELYNTPERLEGLRQQGDNWMLRQFNSVKMDREFAGYDDSDSVILRILTERQREARKPREHVHVSEEFVDWSNDEVQPNKLVVSASPQGEKPQGWLMDELWGKGNWEPESSRSEQDGPMRDDEDVLFLKASDVTAKLNQRVEQAVLNSGSKFTGAMMSMLFNKSDIADKSNPYYAQGTIADQVPEGAVLRNEAGSYYTKGNNLIGASAEDAAANKAAIEKAVADSPHGLAIIGTAGSMAVGAGILGAEGKSSDHIAVAYKDAETGMIKISEMMASLAGEVTERNKSGKVPLGTPAIGPRELDQVVTTADSIIAVPLKGDDPRMPAAVQSFLTKLGELTEAGKNTYSFVGEEETAKKLGTDIGNTCATAASEALKRSDLGPILAEQIGDFTGQFAKFGAATGINVVTPTDITEYVENYNRSIQGQPLVQSKSELGDGLANLVTTAKRINNATFADHSVGRQIFDSIKSIPQSISAFMRQLLDGNLTSLRDMVGKVRSFIGDKLGFSTLETAGAAGTASFMMAGTEHMPASDVAFQKGSGDGDNTDLSKTLDIISERYFRPFMYGMSQAGGALNGLREIITAGRTAGEIGAPAAALDTVGGGLKIASSLRNMDQYFGLNMLPKWLSNTFSQSRTAVIKDLAEAGISMWGNRQQGPRAVAQEQIQAAQDIAQRELRSNLRQAGMDDAEIETIISEGFDRYSRLVWERLNYDTVIKNAPKPGQSAGAAAGSVNATVGSLNEQGKVAQEGEDVRTSAAMQAAKARADAEKASLKAGVSELAADLDVMPKTLQRNLNEMKKRIESGDPINIQIRFVEGTTEFTEATKKRIERLQKMASYLGQELKLPSTIDPSAESVEATFSRTQGPLPSFQLGQGLLSQQSAALSQQLKGVFTAFAQGTGLTDILDLDNLKVATEQEMRKIMKEVLSPGQFQKAMSVLGNSTPYGASVPYAAEGSTITLIRAGANSEVSAGDTVLHEATHSMVKKLMAATPEMARSASYVDPVTGAMQTADISGMIHQQLLALANNKGGALTDLTAFAQGSSNQRYKNIVGGLNDPKSVSYYFDPEEVYANVGQALMSGNKELETFLRKMYGDDLFDSMHQVLAASKPTVFGDEMLPVIQQRYKEFFEMAAQDIIAEGKTTSKNIANAFSRMLQKIDDAVGQMTTEGVVDAVVSTAEAVGPQALRDVAAGAQVAGQTARLASEAVLKPEDFRDRLLDATIEAVDNAVDSRTVAQIDAKVNEVRQNPDVQRGERIIAKLMDVFDPDKITNATLDRLKENKALAPLVGGFEKFAAGILGASESIEGAVGDLEIAVKRQLSPEGRAGLVGVGANALQQGIPEGQLRILLDVVGGRLGEDFQQLLARAASDPSEANFAAITQRIATSNLNVQDVGQEYVMRSFKDDPLKLIAAGFDLRDTNSQLRALVENLSPRQFDFYDDFKRAIRDEMGENIDRSTFSQSMSVDESGRIVSSLSGQTQSGISVSRQAYVDQFGDLKFQGNERGVKGMLGELGTRIKREIPEEFAEEAIYGAIYGLQQMFQQIVSIQDELTEVANLFDAVGEAASNVKADFLFENISAANDTGQDFEAAMQTNIKSMKLLSGIQDPQERTQYASQFARLQLGAMTAFDLQLGEATESVPAIFAQIQNSLKDIEDPAVKAQMALDKLSSIFDKMVIAQRESGAEGRDLIQVYSMLSSTAGNVGLSDDELLSLTAVAAPALNKSPVETANSLKLLIETMYQAGSDDLAKMGIATQVINPEGIIKSRDLNDVLADIGTKLEDPNVDPKKIFEAIGGRARSGEAESFIKAYLANNERVSTAIDERNTGTNFDVVVARRSQDFAGQLNALQGNAALLFERLLVGTGILTKLAETFGHVSDMATGLAQAIKDNPDAFKQLADIMLFIADVVVSKLGVGFNVFEGNIAKLINSFYKAQRAARATLFDFERTGEAGRPLQRVAAVARSAFQAMSDASKTATNQLIADSERIQAAKTEEAAAFQKSAGAQRAASTATTAQLGPRRLSDVAPFRFLLDMREARRNGDTWTGAAYNSFRNRVVGNRTRRGITSETYDNLANVAGQIADTPSTYPSRSPFWDSKGGRAFNRVGSTLGEMALPVALDAMTGGLGGDNLVNIGVGIAGGFIGMLGGPGGAAIGYTIATAFSDYVNIPDIVGTSKEEQQAGKDFIRENLDKTADQRALSANATKTAGQQISNEIFSMFNAPALTADLAKVQGLTWMQPVTSQVSSEDIRKMLANRNAGRPVLEGVEIDAQNFARYMNGVPTRFEEVFDVLTKPENALALQLVEQQDVTDVASDLPRIIGELAKDKTLVGERAAKIEEEAFQSGAVPMLDTPGTVRAAVQNLQQTQSRTQVATSSFLPDVLYGEGGMVTSEFDRKYAGILDDIRSGKLSGSDASGALDQYGRGRESLVGVGNVRPQIQRFAAQYGQDIQGLSDVLYQMGTEGQQQLIQRLQPLFEASQVVQAFEAQQQIVAEYEKSPALLKADPELNAEYLAAKEMLNADRTRYNLAQQRLEIAQREKGFVLDQAKAVEKQVATRRLISKGTPAQFSAPSMFDVSDYSTAELQAAFEYAQEKQRKLIGINPGYANEFKNERFMLEAGGNFKPVSGVSQSFVAEYFQNQKKRRELPDVIDLKDLSPEKLNQTVARARALQGQVVAAAPGLADEYKDSNLLLLGKNNTLLQELGLSQEFLRMALDENTESTDQLRGHFNLPAGYKPPTVWDYYADGGKETGDVNYVKPGDSSSLELAKMIADATLNGPQSAGGPDLGALGNTVMGANPFYTGGTPDIWEDMPPLEVPDSMDVNTVRLSLANDIGDKPKETGFYYTTRYANEMDDAENADKARKSGYYYTTQYANEGRQPRADEYGGYYTTVTQPTGGTRSGGTFESHGTRSGGTFDALTESADKAKGGLTTTSSALQTFARVVASTNPVAASIVNVLTNMDKLSAAASKLAGILGGSKSGQTNAAPGSQNLYIYVNGQQVQVSQQPVTGNGGQTLVGARPSGGARQQVTAR